MTPGWDVVYDLDPHVQRSVLLRGSEVVGVLGVGWLFV